MRSVWGDEITRAVVCCGIVVIAAQHGEPGQIPREAGALVVPPEDSLALADAIRELAISPQRRQAMGRAGRTHVEQCHDRAALAREYRKILDVAGGSR